MKILLIGFGFVGKATYLLNNKDLTVYVYDITPSLCIPEDIILEDVLKEVDLIFVSLPTPTNIDGQCYTGLIDNLLNTINHEFIVIRSTVPVGYCDSLKVFFMPEFLTEKNWKEDFINNKNWLFGTYENCDLEKEEEFKKRITELFNTSYNNKSINYNNISFGKNKEMEMTKLIRNTFLATKVSYFNEIYDLSKLLNVDYDKVIEYVKMDDRIGKSHMLCPGHDNKRGYGGTCFPKDTLSMYNQLIKNNINSYILQSSLDRNENLDRSERDWLKDVNRTNVKNKSKIIMIVYGNNDLGLVLCNKLLEDDNKVIFLDRNIDKMGLLSENKNFVHFNFDIKNKIFIPHVDKIYNLMSISNNNEEEDKLDKIIKYFEGTKNLLDLSLKHNSEYKFVINTDNSDDTDDNNNINNMIILLINEYNKKFNMNFEVLNKNELIDNLINTNIV